MIKLAKLNAAYQDDAKEWRSAKEEVGTSL